MKTPLVISSAAQKGAHEAMLRKLGKYDVGIAITALQDALAGSWQGVFPEKINPRNVGRSRLR